MSINVIASTLANHVASRPLPESPRTISLPAIDEDVITGDEQIGHAEGQSFLIEYSDSKGRLSSRRVTVWSIIAGAGGIASLLAFCHERKARRQFRIDRIKCFVDFDGEIFEDVPAFLIENFGMSVGIADAKASTENRWSAILTLIRSDAVLLTAIIRADGKITDGEVDNVKDYLWARAENTGYQLTTSEVYSMQRYAARLRPTEESIYRSLDEISKRTPSEISRLLRAAVAAMDADDERHLTEVTLINAISHDLIGTGII